MSHKKINDVICVEDKFKVLPHKIYETNLREIIENKFNLLTDEYQIKYSEGSSKGDNYIGIIYRAEILQNNSVILSIIVKLPPTNPIRRDEFFLHRSFVNESDFYNKLYPIYKKYQENKGIDLEKHGFYEIPLCHKTLTAESFEGLYFEDLKTSNFDVYNRTQELTKDHVYLVMKVLAKMHALFLCIKEHDPVLVDSYCKRKDYFILRCERKDSLMNSWFENSKRQALDVLLKTANKKLIKKVYDALNQNILELFKSCLDLKKTEPYATLCHGDCWNSNIMYKHDKNGFPIDIRFLDFQIMRYSSPICDLMYYIFSCTSKSLRDNHYQEFLNVYYNTLSSFINRLRFDPNKLFPRHAFDDHLKKFGKFGLIMGVLVLPVFTSDVDDAPDMDNFVSDYNKSEDDIELKEKNSELSYVTEKTYEIYAKRVLGMCEDMVDLGYI